VVEPGEVELMVGASSEDLPLTATITIVGDTVDVEQNKVFSSGVVVDELTSAGRKS
jgi:beta-glucosidase